MIGRLILTYPEASRRVGGLLVLVVVAAVLYSIGVSSAWIGRILPSSVDWLKENQVGKSGVMPSIGSGKPKAIDTGK